MSIYLPIWMGRTMQCQEDPKMLNVGVYLCEWTFMAYVSNNIIMIVVHEHFVMEIIVPLYYFDNRLTN